MVFAEYSANETSPMSIIDGMPSSEAELQEMLGLAAPHVARVIDAAKLTPKAKSILDLMAQGLSLADICDITSEQRDAMFIKGCRLIQAGDIEKGRDWLTFLHQLEPMDARVVYAIALTYQTEGNFRAAAKCYVHFIARDATNPEGHLRIGECFLSAREYDRAIEHFQIAKDQCELGKGDAAAAAHAAKMLAHAHEKRAAHGLPRQDSNQDSHQDYAN
jgi:tetratricopeptide (TPR) repeat protein